MAYDNIIGIAMDLDVSSLKAGIAETNKTITTARKEFEATSAGMDDWRKSTEGLTAKLKQLDTNLGMYEKQLKGIQAEIDRVSNEEGDHTEQLRRLNNQLLDAQKRYNKTQKEIRIYSGELEQVQSETKEATTQTDRLSRALRDADSATSDFKGGLSTMKVALGNLASQAITSFVGAIRNAIDESREFRRELSYLEATADQTGSDFDHVKDKVEEVFTVLGEEDSAVEGLNNLMTAGFSGDALDKITEQLTGASIQWHDTLKFEGLADGLQETLATDKAIGPFVELLERGGMVAEDFDAGLQACTTEAEKQNYVLETLSKLGLSEVTATYREQNKELIEAQKATFEYNEAQGALGETMEPILTTIKNGWTEILIAFNEMMAGMDLEGLKNSITGAFQWFVDNAVPAIKGIIDWVVKHQEIVLATIAGVVGGFIAWKAVGVATMIAGMIAKFIALIAVQEGATVAQKLLNLAMNANPIGILITVIVALVSAIGVLWATSDKFRKFWINAWNKIKEVARVAWNAIVGFFTKAWEKIKNVWSAVTGFFSNVWKGITSVFSGIGGWFGDVFSGAWDAVTNVWDNVSDWFTENVIDPIVEVFTSLPEKMLEIGKDIVEGLWEGITSMSDWVIDKIQGFGSSVLDGIKDFFNIESPSKLMKDEVGKMLGLGVGEGILSSTKAVVKDARTFSKSIAGGMSANIGRFAGGSVGGGGVASTSTSVTNNFTQVINAPKQPSRIELYRQSKNLLAMRGGY